MKHQTIRGRIDYLTDGVGEMGREWFTLTAHGNGDRTTRTLTEMDDYELVRDVTYTVDRQFRPKDCFTRVLVKDRLVGTGWCRFSDTLAECETWTASEGRVSQRWPLSEPLRFFGPHSVLNDVWQIASFDFANSERIQPFPVTSRLWSSPLIWGGSGPLFCLSTALTLPDKPPGDALEFVGEETVTVPAGTFRCKHVRVLKPGRKRSPTDLWAMGPHLVFVRLRAEVFPQDYVLAEYREERS